MTDLIAEQIDAEIQPEAATSDARRHRPPRLLALLPGAGVGAAMIWTSGILTPSGRVFTLVDDALISMSYARTLVETGEFVWFPGAPKVEGITNPLWALIMTIPQALGLSDSASCLVMSLVGLGCVLGAAFLAGGLAVRMLDPGRAGGTAGAVAAGLTTATVGLGWPLLFWSVFGLEVGFVAMLTVAAIALAVRSAARDLSARSLFAVGGVLAIGLLTRPDFAVVAGAVGLWAVALPARFVAPPSQALAVPPRWQRAAAVWSLPVLAAILLTIARLTYYGAVLPNTYTLKMSGSSALERIGRSWSIHHELLIWGIPTAAAAVLLARRAGVAQRLAVILVVGTAALLAAYALYSGGD
ncbi:MAG: hypothetical protein ACH36H_04310, partial [Candidatus Nanopelagicales bacterium]